MKNNQNNIQFIIHRGSHQIGGNCVELGSPEIGFYLTDVQPDMSGVPATIYVACKFAGFSPRILISKDCDWSNVYEGKIVSISLEKHPEVIKGNEQIIAADTYEKAKRWVVLNYDLLMKHWIGEASSVDLLNNVKKINL